jgi:hypothetical protein
MQASLMNADFKVIKKKKSAFENPRHPRSILFWNADDADASNADERRFYSNKEKIRVHSRLKIRVIRVLIFFVTPMTQMQATLLNSDFKASAILEQLSCNSYSYPFNR